MTELNFSVYAYDVAMAKFVRQVVHGFIALDPLLGSMPRIPVIHKGPTRNVQRR